MKEFYHSKKKKIRGWKRHKRKIERWRQNAMDLDMNFVREHQRDYAKLWIYPFYSINHTNPPNWYNCLLLNEMIDVYQYWNEKMTEENEDYYLKIWLCDPCFIGSQIVVAYRDCLNFYDETFDTNPTLKPFPLHKYKSLANKLALFDWELYIDANMYWESEMQEDIELGFHTIAEINAIKNKSYSAEKKNDDVLYKVSVGDVWLGKIKKEITYNN
ncbi:MAG: hypothetical protein ACRCWQ_06730 [Bacilli bacterium]